MAAFHLEGIVSLRNDAFHAAAQSGPSNAQEASFPPARSLPHCHSMLENRRSEDSVSMRIEVVGDETISSQARTYAEYRVFAALARATGTRDARSARVTLRPLNAGADCGGVACTVTVLFEQSDTVRVNAIGGHPYAAINRAIERLRAAVEPAVARRASV
jgi:ribosome-associated translation inhibitor RaiA